MTGAILMMLVPGLALTIDLAALAGWLRRRTSTAST
jgi:hypothetical protein